MDHDLDALLGSHDAMKRNRIGDEPTWSAITQLLYPDGTPPWGRHTPGEPTRAEIYDNTGEDAAESASAAFQALTTNPATRWFEIGLFDEQIARDTAAGAYLWRMTSKMFRCFRHPTTLFNLAMDEDNQQLIMLGNSCLHIEDKPGRLPLFRAMPMAKVWWEENADGVVDHVDREFELTATAALEKFGSSLPEQVWKMAENTAQAYDLVKFLHVNKPRAHRDASRRDRGNMAYRSVYACLDFPKIVTDGGSHELEYVTSRWRRRAGERYGRGCGHKALSDIEILQRMNRTVMLAGERTVDPAILAPEDGITGPISLKARSINTVRAEYLANGAAPRAMVSNTRVDIGLELIHDRRELVRRSFMKQLLEIVRDPKFTATHVLSIEDEQKRGLAPILGRQQGERFGPIVGRVYNLMRRMPGVFEPSPPEIAGQPLQPNFDTPSAQAMRLGVAKSIAQSLETIAPIIKATGDEALWDNFDLDENLRAFAEGVGMPPMGQRSIDVRDAMRQQRQAIAQQRATLENTKDATVGLKNAAPMVTALTGLLANQNQPAAPQQAAA